MRESFSKRRRTRGTAIIDLALILQLPPAAHLLGKPMNTEYEGN
jgi:hypothetical protein